MYKFDTTALIQTVYLAQDCSLKAFFKNKQTNNLLPDNFLCRPIILRKIMKIDFILSCLFQTDETCPV